MHGILSRYLTELKLNLPVRAVLPEFRKYLTEIALCGERMRKLSISNIFLPNFAENFF